MYSITREDLPLGVMALQSSHALIDYVIKFPEESKEWNKSSNYLGQLVAKNEEELEMLMFKAEKKGIRFLPFYEPDLENKLTAIAFEATILSKKLLSSYPLMFKNIQTV